MVATHSTTFRIAWEIFILLLLLAWRWTRSPWHGGERSERGSHRFHPPRTKHTHTHYHVPLFSVWIEVVFTLFMRSLHVIFPLNIHDYHALISLLFLLGSSPSLTCTLACSTLTLSGLYVNIGNKTIQNLYWIWNLPVGTSEQTCEWEGGGGGRARERCVCDSFVYESL